MYACIYIYIYIYHRVPSPLLPALPPGRLEKVWRRLNGYFAQQVPSLFLASSSRTCLSYAVLEGILPWRASPLS